jgi:hypothetical protein
MCAACPAHLILLDLITFNARGPFAKFVDSPYYSETELCGGAVTVSFSKYLPWQAMHFYNAPPTSWKCAADRWSLPFHGWKSPEIAWGLIWIEFYVWFGKSGSVEPLEHPPYSPDLAPRNFWAFPTTKRELRGDKKFQSDQRSAARFREVSGAL